MNIFNELLSEFLQEKFSAVSPIDKEIKAILKHTQHSEYKKIDISNVWRDRNGVLCTEYMRGNNKTKFYYNQDGEAREYIPEQRQTAVMCRK
ncbi:MAG: hypothetical protein LUH14_04075 [Clostridiaceae bacterium]|nr:hypothetical protein [Clostridiaceae bacterium]